MIDNRGRRRRQGKSQQPGPVGPFGVFVIELELFICWANGLPGDPGDQRRSETYRWCLAPRIELAQIQMAQARIRPPRRILHVISEPIRESPRPAKFKLACYGT